MGKAMGKKAQGKESVRKIRAELRALENAEEKKFRRGITDFMFLFFKGEMEFTKDQTVTLARSLRPFVKETHDCLGKLHQGLAELRAFTFINQLGEARAKGNPLNCEQTKKLAELLNVDFDHFKKTLSAYEARKGE